MHSRKIKVNYHDSTTSFLEACSPRATAALAPVIVEAYKRGCYFDGWEECFKYDTWMQTFADLGIDPAFYCQRPIALDEVTPWSPHGLRHHPRVSGAGVQQGSGRPDHPALQPCLQRMRCQPSVRRSLL